MAQHKLARLRSITTMSTQEQVPAGYAQAQSAVQTLCLAFAWTQCASGSWLSFTYRELQLTTQTAS